jgi:hypothetical protein
VIGLFVLLQNSVLCVKFTYLSDFVHEDGTSGCHVFEYGVLIRVMCQTLTFLRCSLPPYSDDGCTKHLRNVGLIYTRLQGKTSQNRPIFVRDLCSHCWNKLNQNISQRV